MTKKDFELIANAMRSNTYEGMDNLRYAIHSDYCRTLATELSLKHPRFDRDKFLTACGVVIR